MTTRGRPTTNFDFLNELGRDMQVRIGQQQEVFEEQSEDLADLLSNVHVEVKETRKKKRDSDLFFTNQANQLADKSDAITRKTMEAAADPFNDLKALFTKTPSVKEWAVRHNAVQNELNKVKRRYATGAAEYNFEVSELSRVLQNEMQKRELTSQNIQQAQQTSQTISTSILAQDNIIRQQLDAMLLPDLQTELANPNSQLPQFLVQQRISAILQAQADLKASTSAAGKSALDRQKAFADYIKAHPDLVPEEIVQEALVSNKPVTIPNLGIALDPQTAKVILPLQQQAAQERGKIFTEITNNTISSQISMQNMAGGLQRFAGPGVSVIARDETGQPAGFNFEAVPPDLQQQVAEIMELGGSVASMDKMVQMMPNSEATEDVAVTANALRSQIKVKIDTLFDSMVADSTQGMKNEQAIAATDQYIRTGRVNATEGATQLLMEEMATVIPGTMSAGVHGVGWAKGANIFAGAYQEDLNELANRNPELFEGELTEDKLFALALGQTARFEASLAAGSALNRKTGEQNSIQFEVLNDWNERALVYGIRQLMGDHATEPETVRALQALTFGELALSPTITQSPNGMLELFSRLIAIEDGLKASGALPKESSLAHELQRKLLSEAFYTSPEIRGLTRANTPVAASLSRMVFQNDPETYFSHGLQQNVAAIPLDQMPIMIQAAKKRAATTGQMEGINPAQMMSPIPGSLGTEVAESATSVGAAGGRAARAGVEQMIDDFVGHLARQYSNVPKEGQ